ncbi:hypothetical protein KIL84_018637 [Mauremys mutica]|uniref:Uncharacterized protein n=1 Tax=Mauremys mutica TaxID=74926 RepID=A0A9D3XV17_9SAUR|nr:hypothetical protein KIL84_018637 [Mauremys mutica]
MQRAVMGVGDEEDRMAAPLQLVVMKADPLRKPVEYSVANSHEIIWDSGEMCGSDELTDACMTGAQQTGQDEIIDQHKETGKQLDHGIRDFPAMEDSPVV